MKKRTETSDGTEMEQGHNDIKQVLALFDRWEEQKKINVDKHWKSLSFQIRRERFRYRLWNLVRTGAAILLLPLLLMSVIFYQRWSELKSRPVVQVEVESAYGIVSEIMLPDSSIVWLNSGSRLIYPQQFIGEKRRVVLDGQAYFKVKSDAEHSFDVSTVDGIVVSAYGTEFDVQAYADDSCMVATLACGNIHVRQEHLNWSQDLQPGEQLLFARSSQEVSLRNIDLSVVTAWKDGKIVFRRTPMEEVARQLSRHFNVNIQLDGEEVRGYSYSGTFTTESISEILFLLATPAPICCELVEPERQSDGSFSKREIHISLR